MVEKQVNIIDDDEEEKQFEGKHGRRQNKKKGLFQDELKKMMYGFGEDSEPNDETLELLELYVIEFITNVTKRSLARSTRSGYSSIQLRDFLKVIEEDDKKFLRTPYFLTALKSIDTKKIKKISEDDKKLIQN